MVSAQRCLSVCVVPLSNLSVHECACVPVHVRLFVRQCVCVTVFVCLLPSSLPISCSLSLSLSLSVGARQLPKPGLGTIYPQAEKENSNLLEPPSSDPSPLFPVVGWAQKCRPAAPKRSESPHHWSSPEAQEGGEDGNLGGPRALQEGWTGCPPSRPPQLSSSWPCFPAYGGGGWGSLHEVCLAWGLGRPEE